MYMCANVPNRGDEDSSASISVLFLFQSISEAGHLVATELDVELIRHWLQVNEGFGYVNHTIQIDMWVWRETPDGM